MQYAFHPEKFNDLLIVFIKPILMFSLLEKKNFNSNIVVLNWF